MPSREETAAAVARFVEYGTAAGPRDVELTALAYARELDTTPVDRDWAFAVGEVQYVDSDRDSWRVEIAEAFYLVGYGADPIELMIGARYVTNPNRGRVRTEARLRGVVLKEPEGTGVKT